MYSEQIREWLDLWHKLLDDPSSPPFEDPEEMAGVLADLRRSPDRLAQAFAPLPQGTELLTRVQRCIDAEQNHEGIYLIPQTIEATDDQLCIWSPTPFLAVVNIVELKPLRTQSTSSGGRSQLKKRASLLR